MHDIIDGGAGADTITGGLSYDQLTGGEGADVFVYANADVDPTSPGFYRDWIMDFNFAEDKLDLSALTVNNAEWRTPGGGPVEDNADALYLSDIAFLDDYFYIYSTGGGSGVADVIIRFDANGGGDQFVDIIELQNVVYDPATQGDNLWDPASGTLHDWLILPDPNLLI